MRGTDKNKEKEEEKKEAQTEAETQRKIKSTKKAGTIKSLIAIMFFFFSSVGIILAAKEIKNETQYQQKIKPVKEKDFDFWKAVFSEIPFPEKPTQPIAFSHKKHAGELGIDCKFCHYYVEKSKYAGVPSVSNCLGCHKYVASVMQNPEVQKIFKYAEEGKPIPWVKVHDLPDFVRFTHKIHINKGIECYECHGDVAQMDTAQRVAPLNMGWCLECHRKKNASTECFACHY